MFLKNFFAHVSQFFTTVASKAIALCTAVAATVAAVMHFSAATPQVELDEHEAVSTVAEKKQERTEKLTVSRPKFTRESHSPVFRPRPNSIRPSGQNTNATDESTEGLSDGFSLGNRGVDARGLSPKDPEAKQQGVATSVPGQCPISVAADSTNASDSHSDDILTHRELQAGGMASKERVRDSGDIDDSDHGEYQDGDKQANDVKKAEDEEAFENFMKNFSGGDSSAGVNESRAQDLSVSGDDILPGQEAPMTPDSTPQDATIDEPQAEDGHGCIDDDEGSYRSEEDDDDDCNAEKNIAEEDVLPMDQAASVNEAELLYAFKDAAQMASVAERQDEDPGLAAKTIQRAWRKKHRHIAQPNVGSVASTVDYYQEWINGFGDIADDYIKFHNQDKAATKIQRTWRKRVKQPVQEVEPQPIKYDEVLAQLYLREFDEYREPKGLVKVSGTLNKIMFVVKENIADLLLRVGELQHKNKETHEATWTDEIKLRVEAGLKSVLDFLLTWDKCASPFGLKQCGYAAWVNTIKTKEEVDALLGLLNVCDEIVPADQKDATSVEQLRDAIKAKQATFTK